MKKLCKLLRYKFMKNTIGSCFICFDFVKGNFLGFAAYYNDQDPWKLLQCFWNFLNSWKCNPCKQKINYYHFSAEKLVGGDQ